VNCTNPATGRSFDDNLELVDSIGWLSAADKKKIFEENAFKAYPRLAAVLGRLKPAPTT
jgi:hypothetical protein